MTKLLLAAPLLALVLSTGAFAQTESGGALSGSDETDTNAGEAKSSGDTGTGDANSGRGTAWTADVGTALFSQGFSTLRDPEDAQSRWTALPPSSREPVIADCNRFTEAGMTGETAAIDTAIEPLSPQSMTAVCSLVQTLEN